MKASKVLRLSTLLILSAQLSGCMGGLECRGTQQRGDTVTAQLELNWESSIETIVPSSAYVDPSEPIELFGRMIVLEEGFPLVDPDDATYEPTRLVWGRYYEDEANGCEYDFLFFFYPEGIAESLDELDQDLRTLNGNEYAPGDSLTIRAKIQIASNERAADNARLEECGFDLETDFGGIAEYEQELEFVVLNFEPQDEVVNSVEFSSSAERVFFLEMTSEIIVEDSPFGRLSSPMNLRLSLVNQVIYASNTCT